MKAQGWAFPAGHRGRDLDVGDLVGRVEAGVGMDGGAGNDAQRAAVPDGPAHGQGRRGRGQDDLPGDVEVPEIGRRRAADVDELGLGPGGAAEDGQGDGDVGEIGQLPLFGLDEPELRGPGIPAQAAFEFLLDDLDVDESCVSGHSGQGFGRGQKGPRAHDPVEGRQRGGRR